MALALNLDPALMKKSDHGDPTALLFPERELSIRIGSTGLLSGKLAAAAELGQRVRPRAGGRREGNARLSALAAASPTAHGGLCPCPFSHLFMWTLAQHTTC